MKLLKNRILEQGKALENNVLKVDSFLNHQIDVVLMKEIGNEFYNRFKDSVGSITKIVTVESSGIAPALFTAEKFDVPVIFAKKRKFVTLSDDLLSTEVFSYTKNEINKITISKDYIKKGDKLLIIDDFLANGEVIKGLVKLCSEAGAEIVGAGIVIEKAFQKGRQYVEEMGLHVESLARVKSLNDGVITFVE